MAKIRVSVLATKMGVPEQDLLFKLKSIGVRVEGDDPEIDADVIQSILTGKKLHQPKEVILRDGAQQPQSQQRRTPPPRRMPTGGGPRPPRGRRMIQRVEPRPKTIPTRTPPKPEPTPVVEPAAQETASVETREAPPQAVPATKETTRQPAAEHKSAAREEARRTTPVESETVSRSERRAARRDRPATDIEFKGERPEIVTISEGMTVREFAEKLGVKSKDLLQRMLLQGVVANINTLLETETAIEMAEDLGIATEILTFEEEVQREEIQQENRSEHLEDRAPVVTVMGHVDHGKTSLLDRIRSSKVADGEAGGITQHIAAYHVDVKGKRVVFLDTPGHEAFTKLRARGAQVTDIVILVVAADDGVMAQTVEAIQHAKAADVPIIVAINKMDKSNANPDRVKQSLADADILVEDWGGDIVSVPISALKNEGIDQLLELVVLTSDLLELKADPTLSGQGTIIEARKERGLGNVATVLVQSGTLHRGDVCVVGSAWGKVRSMTNDSGQRIETAGPSTPVEVTGFQDLPEAGDVLQVVDSEAKARSIVGFRQDEDRHADLTKGSAISLDQLFARLQDGEAEELPIVVKADVQGSLEVLKDTLTELSTDKVAVKIALSGIGGITTNDITFASASGAIVIGFNVRPEKAAADLARKEGVDIRTYTVIYELTAELQQAMTGLLKPTFKEVDLGRAEVREIFKVPRIGTIAGCHVVEGTIPRNAMARLLRDNVVVYEGKLSSLRRFKDDASEVRSGFDCGIGLDRFQDIKPGDFIEVYERQEVAATL